jgi:hypothetical protein
MHCLQLAAPLLHSEQSVAAAWDSQLTVPAFSLPAALAGARSDAGREGHAGGRQVFAGAPAAGILHSWRRIAVTHHGALPLLPLVLPPLLAADVYSFGIVLWELLTFEFPWGSAANPWQVCAASLTPVHLG